MGVGFFVMGEVGGGEPDDGEEGFVAGGIFAEEVEGGVHGDDGALSLVLGEGAVVAEVGIEVEEVEAGEPGVESLSAG